MSIDNLAAKEVVQKIKSRGYWKVNFHPVDYNPQRIEKRELKSTIDSTVVTLRGWDYPHLIDNHEGPLPINNGIEKVTDWSQFKGFWRMTTSGQ